MFSKLMILISNSKTRRSKSLFHTGNAGVICHINASVDGRILGSRWRPAENRMAGLFERLYEELGGGSWLIGR